MVHEVSPRGIKYRYCATDHPRLAFPPRTSSREFRNLAAAIAAIAAAESRVQRKDSGEGDPRPEYVPDSRVPIF